MDGGRLPPKPRMPPVSARSIADEARLPFTEATDSKHENEVERAYRRRIEAFLAGVLCKAKAGKEKLSLYAIRIVPRKRSAGHDLPTLGSWGGMLARQQPAGCF